MNTSNDHLIKETEAETLATFQEEIPSMYFSHLGEEEYLDYVKNAEFIYQNHFKFPPKMFEGSELIDFGAGTGENTIYLANWGAKCTLIEMNEMAQKVSRDVFAKYAKHPEDHSFYLSSIFDYEPNEKKLYDIVHCRGVLSHTAAKEKAFAKIAAFVKPGGFLIFGDPNKAGGFQNMLQRYAVYSFARSPDEMVEVSEFLFKEDIDRSQRTIPRTRRAIIFDRWVIQCQDDPSVGEVVGWANNAGLKLYSSFPPLLLSMIGDSLHHRPAFDPYSLPELFSIAEAIWMTQTVSAQKFLEPVAFGMKEFSEDFEKLTKYVSNLNSSSIVEFKEFEKLAANLKNTARTINPLYFLIEKLSIFLNEAVDFVQIVQAGNLNDVRDFIERTEHLFRGACGNRHVDFIAYRPK